MKKITVLTLLILMIVMAGCGPYTEEEHHEGIKSIYNVKSIYSLGYGQYIVRDKSGEVYMVSMDSRWELGSKGKPSVLKTVWLKDFDQDKVQ